MRNPIGIDAVMKAKQADVYRQIERHKQRQQAYGNTQSSLRSALTRLLRTSRLTTKQQP